MSRVAAASDYPFILIQVRTGINQDAPVPRKQQSAAEMVARNPDSLLEGFVDKLCRYVGVIKEVPIEADMSNRTYLLDKLDDARVRGVAAVVIQHAQT